MCGMRTATLLCAALIFSLPTAVLAQDGCVPPPNPAPVVASPAGTLFEGIGYTDLPITTSSEKARQLAHQGFALIHCFWFNEAVRSFRDATREDPNCAIAWLGLNASLTLPWHRPNVHRAEAEYAIRRAMQLSGDASPLEQALIAAYRLRSMSQDDRNSDWERAMDGVIAEFPDIMEPRLLLAVVRVQICLNDGYDEQGEVSTEMQKVMALIKPVLERDPNHAGALHYHIHALEGNDADAALRSADQLGRSAPKSSHMVHMPGHIYNRVGKYDRAHEVFHESRMVDEVYFSALEGGNRSTNWNYGHNLDFLIFNLAEAGRLKEAEEALEVNPGSLQRVAWRSADWKRLADRSRLEESNLSSRAGFFHGMAALARGDVAEAARISGLIDAAVQGRAEGAGNFAITSRRLDRVHAAELRGAVLSVQGRHEEAIVALRDAADTFEKLAYSEPPNYIRPPHETLGEALIRAGRYDEAVAAYEAGLVARPNSGWMLFGIGRAHEEAGRAEQARVAYARFLSAWSTADKDLPQVQRASNFVR
jgi:tetratricopeptide (TPR) repeat protein